MSIEDPQPGDRFKVTFEGTFRTAPDRLWIGEGAGLSWGIVAEHAVSVEPIGPEIELGALYMDGAGKLYHAAGFGSQTLLVDFDSYVYGGTSPRPLPPGLRRARLVPDTEEPFGCVCGGCA